MLDGPTAVGRTLLGGKAGEDDGAGAGEANGGALDDDAPVYDEAAADAPGTAASFARARSFLSGRADCLAKSLAVRLRPMAAKLSAVTHLLTLDFVGFTGFM